MKRTTIKNPQTMPMNLPSNWAPDSGLVNRYPAMAMNQTPMSSPPTVINSTMLDWEKCSVFFWFFDPKTNVANI